MSSDQKLEEQMPPEKVQTRRKPQVPQPQVSGTKKVGMEPGGMLESPNEASSRDSSPMLLPTHGFSTPELNKRLQTRHQAQRRAAPLHEKTVITQKAGGHVTLQAADWGLVLEKTK